MSGKKKIEKIIKATASEFASPTLSIGAGLVLGPVGAIGGAVFGDFLQRLLSHKEKNRIDMLLKEASFICQAYEDKYPRNNFLNKKIDEFNEGVLLIATKSYEEKKIKLLAHLIAMSQYSSVPIENLNQALICSEQLSYRQLCLLSIIGKKQQGSIKIKDENYHSEIKINPNEKLIGILYDYRYLLDMNFIIQAGAMLVPVTDINLSRMSLTYIGNLLFDALNLGSIKDDEYLSYIEIVK